MKINYNSIHVQGRRLAVFLGLLRCQLARGPLNVTSGRYFKKPLPQFSGHSRQHNNRLDFSVARTSTQISRLGLLVRESKSNFISPPLFQGNESILITFSSHD